MTNLFAPHSLSRKTTLAGAISLAVIGSLLLGTIIVHAQSADFAVGANPTTLCVNPGINAQSSISVSSLGGFAGTVNLGASVSPSETNGPTLSSIPSSVDLTSGQVTTFDLTMYTTTSTPLYAFTVSVSGISGGVLHTANIELIVSSGCSVGATLVPTTLGTLGSDLGIGIAVAGLVGIVAVSAMYVNRRRNSPKP